ncbi:hypothetical protein UH38_09100 [Aliterella atlantica CENA595]|uniref:Uncharacterized protein n=1 Tax=Aliterella atlantica CENA595 TaxID=1618023 RepID=A0A0D8ZV19_9CYAN|nr:hypothetical protein UH38_09100 [Aliterella atlantica CENA595]
MEQQELFKLDAYTSYTTDWQLDTCSGATIISAPEQTQKVVLEQAPPPAPEQPAPEQTTSAPEQKHWVEIYSPSKRKNYSYYRYVWMEGRKLKHLHIGGSSTSLRAIALKEKVLDAIAHLKAPQEIVKLIKGGNG